MKTIAVIEDDLYIGNLLEELLTSNGYRVLRAYSGTEAVLLLSGSDPDLVLLDLMLPGLPGEKVLPVLKGIPTIVLSAKVDMDSKVRLLLDGAADYITKPFDSRELLARIAVQLRKADHPASHILTARGLTMDTGTHRVWGEGKEVHLTRTEYAILKLLLQNPSQVVTKSQMLDRISLDTPDCTESSLKQHMSNLRRKLREAGGGECIESVWGIGFKLAGES